MSRIGRALICLGWILSWGASTALAWDKHETLMPWVLGSLPSALREKLDRPLKAPCPADDLKTYETLQKTLVLNPNQSFGQMKLRTTAESCSKPVTAMEILARGFVDDPDQGMDKDLPDSADPEGYRKWMGGKTGPTSQGFRHMYFGGWTLKHPIETFQIPLHAIGLSPERAQILDDEARALFAKGESAWAWRVASWELHYLQDLAQPFHAVQVLTPRMLPLRMLFSHFGDFNTFIHDGTRIVTNYHWAYEGLVREQLRLGQSSPLATCLRDVAGQVTVALPDGGNSRDFAHAMAAASVELGGRIGKAIMQAFGTGLKEPDVDLAKDRGAPDYKALAVSPIPEFSELNQLSCHVLANAILVSQRIISQSVALNKQ